MASLNLSINGPSIKSSYQGVVNGPAISSSSSTYAQWALFSVQAPLANAFQDNGAKESVLKVASTGEGELADLVEDFSEGHIQFAYVKVKDPNTGLPKNVLIAWCGGGVPERTKGYFTSHLAAVSKVLHGYHVQITARSDNDLAPEAIMRKVSDASGAKYTAGGSAPMSDSAPPPLAKKPVFTPTASSSGSSFNPLVAARSRRQDNVDADGWGTDAPPVTRTQVERVESAYKPTKVNMAELLGQKQESSGFNGSAKADDQSSNVIKGAYQPVGKVDIAAIRAQARGNVDDRPTTVKGAYEPIGKVDIAAIRAKAQRPSEPVEEASDRPRSLADRTSAFTQSERLTELPRPKVANRFGASSFTGTKAPVPGAFGSTSSAAPVGVASRTFADQGGKTPAQVWAEKKARQGGSSSTISPPVTSPTAAQQSGSEWRSGYAGKSWAAVQTSNFGRSGVESQKTGGTEQSEPEAPPSPAGGISALRDRFKDAQAMGASAQSRGLDPREDEEEPAPPPLPSGSRPAGGFSLPGLPSRPAAENQDEEEEEEPEPSPVRLAAPVSRTQQPELVPADPVPPQPLPTREIEKALPKEEELADEEESYDPRAAAAAIAEESFGGAQAQGSSSGKRALIQYDYEKAEDNELELREGEHVTNIEMVDDDWWMGTNSRGESGLFPSNYVELVEGGDEDEAAPAAAAHHAAIPPPASAAAEPEPGPAASGGGGATATALFDYEAAEDNELGFPEGGTVTNLEFPDEDWWFGHYNGASGLFPANYVQLDA